LKGSRLPRIWVKAEKIKISLASQSGEGLATGADCSFLAGKPGDPGRPAADNRRFRRRTLKGVFESLFEALSGDPDFEYAIIDGMIVRVRQHGTGAKGGRKIRPLALVLVLSIPCRVCLFCEERPVRRTCGLTTKTVAMWLDNLAGVVLPPGQGHASAGVAPWIEKIACDALRGDMVFDNDWRRARAVIPPKAGRGRQISGDLDLYKWSLQMASSRRTLLLRS
jgi:hypothetical protein